jgi:BirA family biotin operon repressor/biotin-[acetyl-CoA-carboxylase] ligase
VRYPPLTPADIRRGLDLQVIGREIVCLRTVGSTNDWLRAAAAEGAPEGLVVFAEEQTHGRGQAGRTWLAPPGSGLLVSVLLRPSLPLDRLATVSMLGATATAGAAVEQTGLPIVLKWPNDLIVGGRKLGGILTDSSIEGSQIDYAILGIGMNVNLSRRALAAIPGATSLQAELGHRVDRTAVARALVQALDLRYADIRHGQLEGIFAEWRERLHPVGQWVTLRVGEQASGPFFALRAAPDGALILLRPDGTTVQAVAGEVSVRPAPLP